MSFYKRTRLGDEISASQQMGHESKIAGPLSVNGLLLHNINLLKGSRIPTGSGRGSRQSVFWPHGSTPASSGSVCKFCQFDSGIATTCCAVVSSILSFWHIQTLQTSSCQSVAPCSTRSVFSSTRRALLFASYGTPEPHNSNTVNL